MTTSRSAWSWRPRAIPAPTPKGSEIKGLDAAASDPDVEIFHAGTKRDGGRILADGGRVLGVTARGATSARRGAAPTRRSTRSTGRTASAAATSAGAPWRVRRSNGRAELAFASDNVVSLRVARGDESVTTQLLFHPGTRARRQRAGALLSARTAKRSRASRSSDTTPCGASCGPTTKSRELSLPVFDGGVRPDLEVAFWRADRLDRRHERAEPGRTRRNDTPTKP